MRLDKIGFAFLSILVASQFMWAEENVDFLAEHLFESQMDAQYQSLLGSFSRPNLTLTFEHQKANYLNYRGLNLTVAAPVWRHGDVDFGLGAFYARAVLSGKSGVGSYNPLYFNPRPTPTNSVINADPQSGHLDHSGIGFFASWQSRKGYRWTLATYHERLTVSDFSVNFEFMDGRTGTIQYDSSYRYTTPMLLLERRVKWRRLKMTYSLGGFYPLSAHGFRGRLLFEHEVYEGDTAAAGYGVHIGRPFLGVGTDLLWRQFRFDLGAGLYLLGVEGSFHRGLERSVILKFGYALGCCPSH